MNIPRDRADEYQGMLEEQTDRITEMVSGIEEEVTERLQQAIEVSRELERVGVWKADIATPEQARQVLQRRLRSVHEIDWFVVWHKPPFVAARPYDLWVAALW